MLAWLVLPSILFTMTVNEVSAGHASGAAAPGNTDVRRSQSRFRATRADRSPVEDRAGADKRWGATSCGRDGRSRHEGGERPARLPSR
jgi:hypothetical protein